MNVEHALELAERGWPVLWLGSRSKKPDGTLCPHGAHSATVDRDRIRQWAQAAPDGNIGVATGTPGPDVLDIDDAEGAGDIAIQCRDHRGPVVATARGLQYYFAGTENGTLDFDWGELRRRGSYVVVPPSIHPSGREYAWVMSPNGLALPRVPDGLMPERSGKGSGEQEPPAEKVPHGARHGYLTDFVIRMARSGITDPKVLLAHLETEFRERCELDPQPEPGSLEKLAKWAADTGIAERERRRAESRFGSSPSSPPPYVGSGGGDDDRPSRLYLRQWREEDICRPRWIWSNRIPIGSITTLVGDGGSGKGTLTRWVIARLTQAEMDGEFTVPVPVLVIGTHEDGVGDKWVPGVKAAGGDVSLVHSLEAGLDGDFELVRDIGQLERFVRAEGFKFLYIDQALDHLAPRADSKDPLDVRRALKPIGRLVRELGMGALVTLHPSYRSATEGMRSAGSVQWRNVSRCELALGYHPDETETDVRVLARSKANIGTDPPALVYGVDRHLVINPATQERVVEWAVGEMVEDYDLTARDVQFDRPKGTRREPMHQIFERVLKTVGGDGKWHSRDEGLERCEEEGVSARGFDREYPKAKFIDRDHEGKDHRWKLR